MLRPSLCPHHALMYRSRARSYRELPLRIAELGGMYRSELSGVLGGLTRVRAIQLNDARVFCTLDQAVDEAGAALKLISRAYADLGIRAVRHRLSLPGEGVGEGDSGGKYEVPRCGMCGGGGRLTGVGPDGKARICERCQSGLRRQANPCVVCGRRDIAFRDREGHPRCRSHPPEGGADPLGASCVLVQRDCPEVSLDVIADVVRAIEPVRIRQRQLMWVLLDRPDLFTGGGAKGPRKTVALIKALQEHGAWPQQNNFCNEFSDHADLQADDPSIAVDRCAK